MELLVVALIGDHCVCFRRKLLIVSQHLINFERKKDPKDHLEIGPYALVEKWLDKHLIEYTGIEPDKGDNNLYAVYIKGEALTAFFHFSSMISWLSCRGWVRK